MHTLILSTGGSLDPLIYCIERLKPNRVVFLCSRGSLDSVEKILSQSPLPEFDEKRDVVILDQRLGRKDPEETSNELDQLDAVYLKVRDTFARLRLEDPGCRISVDYTGGTKTMAAGLALAAMDDPDVEQLLVTTATKREANQQSISGHSKPIPVSRGRVYRRRIMEAQLPQLLNRFDYVGAMELISSVRSLFSGDPLCDDILLLETALEAFDAWDRFDHGKALTILESLTGEEPWTGWFRRLKRVIGSRQQLDPETQTQAWQSETGHGFEVVEDLLLNAERRARQERYDDAVGRLYRAMELTAQLLLRCGVRERLCGDGKTEGIRTAGVVIEHLPEGLRSAYLEKKKQSRKGEGPLQLALTESYKLLADLDHPAGARWNEREGQLKDALKHRNNSLFAHGFQPISYSQWTEFNNIVGPFIRETISAETSTGSKPFPPIPQFPSALDKLGFDE